MQEYGVGIFERASTKSALKKALKKKLITVDDKIASTATFIKGGERIELTIPQRDTLQKKLNFPLQVIYEDDYLAAIHKPAGILVSGNRFKTIANALSQNLQPSKRSDAVTPQPVHRLDYNTTGLLLVGKTSEAIRMLNKAFENKGIKKIYFAVTIGAMEKDGQVDLEIDGKKAFTTYEVMQLIPSPKFKALNLVQLSPRTGRRHQLRKHLSAMGNPILGDQEYGLEHLILKGKGLYLHAHSLEFEHPFTGKKVLLQDRFPKKFRKIFNSLDPNL